MGIEQPEFHPVQEEFLQAGIELGFEVNDPNGPNKIGIAKEKLQNVLDFFQSGFYIESMNFLQVLAQNKFTPEMGDVKAHI